MKISIYIVMYVGTFKEWVSFYGFMGNESQPGTNKLREPFVPHYDSFPMNPEKKTPIPDINKAFNKDWF